MDLKKCRQRLRDLDTLQRDVAAARLRELTDLQRECLHETVVSTSYSRTDTLGNYTSAFNEYRLCLTCGLEEMRRGFDRQTDQPFEVLEAPRSRAKKVELLLGSEYDKRKRNWLVE